MKKEKQDLTEFTERELSLWVFNDEGLYKLRKRRHLLFEVLEENFIFTDEQRRELETDLDEDDKE